MTKEAALYGFFNSFGIPGYPESGVPAGAAFPYLTYEPVTGAWGDGEAAITVNLWYYGDGEAEANAKARELAERIGLGGRVVRCDGGAVWLKRGSPWCQSLAEDADPRIRRRYIQVAAEFLTQD